jgi:hypothetical protein
LSPIPETGNSSRAPTPKRPRSPTPAGVEKEIDSRRSQASKASEASGSESTAEIQPEGANWTVGGRFTKLGGDFKGNPFKAEVDLVDHEGLRLKQNITLRGVVEEMLTMQCLVGIHHIIASMFSDLSLMTFFLICLQAFLWLTVLYCYLRKVFASDDGPEGLRKKLTEAEEKSANLKKVVAKHEEDLRVLGEHSTMMECESSDASKARDRAEAKLLKLSEEVKLLRSENAKLREDHRVL